MRIEQQGGGEVLLPVSEVQRRYGVGKTKVYHLLQAGEIEGVLVGGKRLITVDSLNSMVARAPRFITATPNGEGV